MSMRCSVVGARLARMCALNTSPASSLPAGNRAGVLLVDYMLHVISSLQHTADSQDKESQAFNKLRSSLLCNEHSDVILF